MAHAVEVAGVEQRDAGIERGVDGGDALAAVGGAVEVGHAHAAEAELAETVGPVEPSLRVSMVVLLECRRRIIRRQNDAADMGRFAAGDKLDNPE